MSEWTATRTSSADVMDLRAPVAHAAAEQFRDFFAEQASTVAVVTSFQDGTPRGFTCTACCAVTDSPPTLFVGVNRFSETVPAITASQEFAVNWLSLRGQRVATTFAGKSTAKFADVPWRTPVDHLGGPVLHRDSLATAHCRVETVVENGSHLAIFAQIIQVEMHNQIEEPLLYHRRAYRQLTDSAAWRSGSDR